MSEYYTSDLHFHHGNILKFCDRPVGTKTNEQWIFDQIAELPKGSTLWHLGDLCFGKNVDLHKNLVEILKFIIVDCGLNLNMLVGNHDNRQAIQKALVEVQEKYNKGGEVILRDYYEISKAQMEHNLGRDYKSRLGITAEKIVLFHFPIHEWNKCHKGSLHFHGHCHGNLEGKQMYNRIDVGLDSLGKIMTMEEVIKTLVFRNKSAIMYPNHH